jgi:hypothetical protein
MTSQLHNASCFQSISSGTSNANVDLKQPLIVVQDLESVSSSYSQEEQKTDVARRGLSNLIFMKSLCFGTFVGLLLQVIGFSAFWVFTIRWGKNPKPDESAPLSHWTALFLISHTSIALSVLVWGGFVMTLTRKASMQMRKKFDNDADAPNSEFIWTPRFFFRSTIGFHLGLVVASFGWAIVDIELGIPASLASLLSPLLPDVGLCCLMIKFFECFDWVDDPFTAADDDPEIDQEDSLFA